MLTNWLHRAAAATFITSHFSCQVGIANDAQLVTEGNEPAAEVIPARIRELVEVVLSSGSNRPTFRPFRFFPSGLATICFTPVMQTRLAALTMMAVMTLAPAAIAGGKKEHKSSVTFHMETAGTDNPKMIFPQMTNGQQRFYMRTQEIGSNDIESFVPFPSDREGEYGLVITVKPTVVGRLAAVTNTNPGRWMLTMVNGRVVDGVMIDKQISDGKLIIWKGVTLQDITLLDHDFPRTGESGKKKK